MKYCSKCGTALKDDSVFCSKCGERFVDYNPAPTTGTEPKNDKQNETKKLVLGLVIGFLAAAIICLVLFFSGIIAPESKNAAKEDTVSSGESAENEKIVEDALAPANQGVEIRKGIEGSGFSSAEDALRAYMNAFENQDMDEMLSCFAVESFSKNMDFDKEMQRLKTFTPWNTNTMIPIFGDFSRDINSRRREGNLSQSIFYQYFTFMAPVICNQDAAGIPFVLASGDSGELYEKYYSITDDLELKNKFSFSNVFIDPADLSQQYTDEVYKNLTGPYLTTIGAQDIKPVIAEFEFDGKEYLMFADAVKYDNKWYLLDLGGYAAGLMGTDPMHRGIATKEELGFQGQLVN